MEFFRKLFTSQEADNEIWDFIREGPTFSLSRKRENDTGNNELSRLRLSNSDWVINNENKNRIERLFLGWVRESYVSGKFLEQDKDRLLQISVLSPLRDVRFVAGGYEAPKKCFKRYDVVHPSRRGEKDGLIEFVCKVWDEVSNIQAIHASALKAEKERRMRELKNGNIFNANRKEFYGAIHSADLERYRRLMTSKDLQEHPFITRVLSIVDDKLPEKKGTMATFLESERLRMNGIYEEWKSFFGEDEDEIERDEEMAEKKCAEDMIRFIRSEDNVLIEDLEESWVVGHTPLDKLLTVMQVVIRLLGLD